jgi:hypothetical protein
MQIETGYSSNPFSQSSVRGEVRTSTGQDQSREVGGAESPEYKAVSNKAAILLSNSDITPTEKAKILNLLARAKTAAARGATGELSVLLNKMQELDPTLAAGRNSAPEGTPKSQVTAPGQDEGSVTYKDQSSDVGVSFAYPVAKNKYQAPLAVRAHESEHVMIAQAEALMNDQNVTTYVSIHNGYDSRGRLIITGGTTTVITSPKRQIEPIETGRKLDVIA